MMVFVWIGVGIVALLPCVATLTDLSAWRSGRPIRGVDHEARREAGRAVQTELRRNQTFGGSAPFETTALTRSYKQAFEIDFFNAVFKKVPPGRLSTGLEADLGRGTS